MHFSGTCKWTVDQYCITYNGSCPMDIPDDYEEAAKMMCGREYYTVQSRSRMVYISDSLKSFYVMEKGITYQKRT